MENKNDIPKEYIPFEELVICSNTMINGKVPFEINKHIPLLIGKANFPLIWLYVPRNMELNTWDELVKENNVVNKRQFRNFLIEVEKRDADNSVMIRRLEKTIINVRKESDIKANVTALDLRPLGLNIFGNEDGLHVGGQNFVRNTFKNVQTMIAIGNK